VESDDLSFAISDELEDVTAWTIEYDRRRQRVLCFPNDEDAVWVLYKTVLTDPALGGQVSAWSRWTTTHSMGYSPTTVMQLVNPLNFQDTVYMGDGDGNIYVTESDADTGQDGGTDDITLRRRSAGNRSLLSPEQRPRGLQRRCLLQRWDKPLWSLFQRSNPPPRLVRRRSVQPLPSRSRSHGK
jgi:hypothetical protein